jgi:hypothetical protein
MTRLSSLQIPLIIVLISSVSLLISVVGLLNAIVYDFEENEFWFFLILSLLSVGGYVAVARSPVLYYNVQNLTIKRFNQEEVISMDHIDKLYLELSYRNSIALLSHRSYYFQAEIVFKPILRRKSVSFMAEAREIEKFQQMLETR